MRFYQQLMDGEPSSRSRPGSALKEKHGGDAGTRTFMVSLLVLICRSSSGFSLVVLIK